MKDQPSQWVASRLTCREVVDCTTDYLEDRLPILTKIRVGLHVASCANCRAYVKQIALVPETVARLPKPLPSSINRLRLRLYFAALHGQAS